ncbi:MAG TPA: YitT family protein [bacterium]|nr:YitT family protein [bacterium]
MRADETEAKGGQPRMRSRGLKQGILDFTMIALGSVIMGLAYALFIIPHHFVAGGVTGIAVILNYFFRFPVGIQVIIFNIPLFAVGIRYMGRRYGAKSLAGMIASSLMIDFFNRVVKLPSATSNPILASIYGGVMLGIGLGIVFRGRASTGGTDIIGQILNRYTGMSIGFGIMIVDFIIISASGLVFRNLEAPLYGYLVLFLSSRVIDMILEGWNYSKLVIITSAKVAEIQDYILHTLDRSGTALKARSLYLNREGEVIITVIHRKQLADLRKFIKDTDPDAFVIINDTYTVLGRGFKSSLVS